MDWMVYSHAWGACRACSPLHCCMNSRTNLITFSPSTEEFCVRKMKEMKLNKLNVRFSNMPSYGAVSYIQIDLWISPPKHTIHQVNAVARPTFPTHCLKCFHFLPINRMCRSNIQWAHGNCLQEIQIDHHITQKRNQLDRVDLPIAKWNHYGALKM